MRASRDFLLRFLSLTRSRKSASDLNLPFFLRSAMMAVAMPWPKFFNRHKAEADAI